MKRVLLGFMSLLLVAVPAAADSPEATIRAFYRAMFARDAAAMEKLIVPDARSSRLLAGGKIDRERMKQLEESLQLHPESALLRGKPVEPAKNGSFPDGTVMRYTAAVEGNISVVTVVRQTDGWKVDLRWWLSALENQGPPAKGTPEYAIKHLLLATARHDRDEAKKWILPGSDVEILFLEAPPQPEPSDQLVALAMEMPIVEMKKGEFVRMPFDRAAEGTDEPDRKIYQGLFGMVDLPFVVMKRDGAWRVIPQPYYVMMNQ